MKPVCAAMAGVVIACMGGCKATSRPNSAGLESHNPTMKKSTTEAVERREECTINTPLDPEKPGSPGHLLSSTINPNGDSELAVLMRQMRDGLRGARDHLLRDEAPPPMLAIHSKIRCSWPTDPHVRNSKFDEMAISYLLAIEDLERETEIEDKKMAYGRALNSCVTCHQNTCPGPIAAIRALELPE